MKRCLMLCMVVMFALSAGNLSAAQVACPTNTDVSVLQGFNSLANACFTQDKLFYGFVYTPTGSAGAASGVAANLIFQTAAGLDIHGWNFSSSSWVQGVGGPAQFTLGFTIQVCPSGSACFGSVVPGTTISGADAVYAPVSTFAPGNEVVTWSNGTTATLTSTSPGPLPSGGNIGFSGAGPISVSANFSGIGAITQTTMRFYETVPTGVPEPVSISLAGVGLLAISLFARKRRKKA